jgi:hypothetical protein
MAVSTLPVAPGRDNHRPARNRDRLGRGFRAYWRWKSRQIGGRPKIDSDIRALIRRMSRENPLWSAPRIHGELLMLGIEVAESTVSRYMVRRRRPPSQGWKIFLRNHAAGIASLELLIMKRSRRRGPNLTGWDRLILGFCTLLVSPRRLGKVALLRLHRALVKRRSRSVRATLHLGQKNFIADSRHQGLTELFTLRRLLGFGGNSVDLEGRPAVAIANVRLYYGLAS